MRGRPCQRKCSDPLRIEHRKKDRNRTPRGGSDHVCFFDLQVVQKFDQVTRLVVQIIARLRTGRKPAAPPVVHHVSEFRREINFPSPCTARIGAEMHIQRRKSSVNEHDDIALAPHVIEHTKPVYGLIWHSCPRVGCVVNPAVHDLLAFNCSMICISVSNAISNGGCSRGNRPTSAASSPAARSPPFSATRKYAPTPLRSGE